MKRLARCSLLALTALLAGACRDRPVFDPQSPAQGPGALVGNGRPVTSGQFAGGDDVLPAPRAVTPPDGTRPPDCDAACVAYCEGAGLENPVNRGLCKGLWGVGLAPARIDFEESCRRMVIDLTGAIPSAAETRLLCAGSWGETARRLMEREDFIEVNQRRAADRYLYSTLVVNVQSIYDLDALVGKLYRGLVPYDLFAAVLSAHPVIVRRQADPRDTAEAVFVLLMGRPPFDDERADLGRLYATWQRGYYDHPALNMRVPDSFVRFPCLDEEGEVDPLRRGQCTSVLWGFNEIILQPDLRATRDRESGELVTWNGVLEGEEWATLQLPGRALAKERAFWEHAVDQVLLQYLGYDLGTDVPAVREELVNWLVTHEGDIRSVHYAVLTSAAYLQSARVSTPAPYRWVQGPLKQVEAETWIQSVARLSGKKLEGGCDYRISHPEEFLQSGSLSSYRLLKNSDWSFNEDGELELGYADLARDLGGCQQNVASGRFKVISILTTARQLSFVDEVCNPRGDAPGGGVAVQRLLPGDLAPSLAMTDALGEEVARHQYRTFLGRSPSSEETAEARAAAAQCALGLCTAENFARPLCFALLSSAEVLFY